MVYVVPNTLMTTTRDTYESVHLINIIMNGVELVAYFYERIMPESKHSTIVSLQR